MCGGKHYVNLVNLESDKDAVLMAGVEGYDSVKCAIDSKQPMKLLIDKPRRYLTAVRKSLQYSRMGILNCILRKR